MLLYSAPCLLDAIMVEKTAADEVSGGKLWASDSTEGGA